MILLEMKKKILDVYVTSFFPTLLLTGFFSASRIDKPRSYSFRLCLLLVMTLSITIKQEYVRIGTIFGILVSSQNHRNIIVDQQGRSTLHLDR